MTGSREDPLIADYLHRLDQALATLPRERRDELRSEIEQHIAEASAGDGATREILDRLGEPEEIAAEAGAGRRAEPAKAGPLEIAALLLIGAGGFVFPFVPWVAGTVLVWRSPCWTSGQKWRGAYIPLFAALVAATLVLVLGSLGGSYGVPAELVALLTLGMLLPFGCAIYLSTRLGRRLHPVAWSAWAVVVVAVLFSIVASYLPESSRTAVTSYEGAQPRCRGVYQTTSRGGGLGGTVTVSAGLCSDGHVLRRAWGPDCDARSSVAARVKVIDCRLVQQPGGGVVIERSYTYTPVLSPFVGGGGAGGGSYVAPDFSLDR